jgi:hypothetical protein
MVLQGIGFMADFALLYDRAFAWDVTSELDTVDFLVRRFFGRTADAICEVGAGTGRFTLPLARKRVLRVAIEPDSAMRAILERKLLSGCQADCLPKVFAGPVENMQTDELFDVSLLMTDTLSYIFPGWKLQLALDRIFAITMPGGLVVADVALWQGAAGEQRYEKWTVNQPEGTLLATCHASVNIGPGDSRIERSETLRFRLDGQEAVRHSVLHAFDFSRLATAFAKAGFGYCGAAFPGLVELVDPANGHWPRIVAAFRRPFGVA